MHNQVKQQHQNKCTISKIQLRSNSIKNSLENVKSQGKKVGLRWRGGLFHTFRAAAVKT